MLGHRRAIRDSRRSRRFGHRGHTEAKRWTRVSWRKLDVQTRMKKAEMDRRQFFLRAIAAGATAPAVAAGLRARGVAPRPRRMTPAGALVTVSQEQQQTWIKNFNPFLSKTPSAGRPMRHLRAAPDLQRRLTGETVPWLATAWAFSADNLTLTFTIREGVTWSDGTPFTAGDVAFTHNLLKANEALPGGSGGVRAVLPTTSPAIEATGRRRPSSSPSARSFTPGLWDIGEQMIVPEHIWRPSTTR